MPGFSWLITLSCRPPILVLTQEWIASNSALTNVSYRASNDLSKKQKKKTLFEPEILPPLINHEPRVYRVLWVPAAHCSGSIEGDGPAQICYGEKPTRNATPSAATAGKERTKRRERGRAALLTGNVDIAFAEATSPTESIAYSKLLASKEKNRPQMSPFFEDLVRRRGVSRFPGFSQPNDHPDVVMTVTSLQ